MRKKWWHRHRWVFLEKIFILDTHGPKTVGYRFYCEGCLEIKDIKL